VNIRDGKLIYTNALIEKVRKVFRNELQKKVVYEDIERTAACIIDEFILSLTGERADM